MLRLGSTGCCYVLFNPFSINSGSLFIQFDQIQQNFDALIHLLGGDALAGAVEVEAAGAEVRAGQAHIAQGRAVGAAADRGLDGFKARRADGLAGVLEQMEVG